jgi:hypothetical protein
MPAQKSLKHKIRLLIFDAMKNNEKRPCDIAKNTSHTPGFVSKFLKTDYNHSLDSVEKIFFSLGYEVHVELKPVLN